MLYPTPAHAQFRYERLVDGGDVAPGTGGATFHHFYAPTMSKSGDVAFIGESSHEGTSEQRSGIWMVDESGLTDIATAGQSAPHTDLKFREFQPPALESGLSMGSAGEVVFSHWRGRHVALDGSYYWDDGAITTLLGPGANQPGYDPGRIEVAPLPLIGVDGTSVFSGHPGYVSDLVAGPDAWRGRPGRFEPLLDEELLEAAPRPDLHGYIRSETAIFDRSFFVAGIKYAAGPSSIYKVVDDRIERVSTHGDLAPGTQNAEFSVFTGVRINARTQVAFTAWLDEDTGDTEKYVNDRGIWLHDWNGIRLVARTGQHAPGFASGVKFDLFELAGLTADGGVVFYARLRRKLNPFAAIDTYWIGSPDGIRLIAREGRPATGTSDPKIRSFNGLFGGLFVNASGDMVFDVELRGGDRALYWYDDGQAELIAREGRPIYVQGEGPQTVESFHVPSRYCSTVGGRACPITDGDQLTLIINTSESGAEDEDSIFRVSPTDTCSSRCDTYEYCDFGKCVTYPTDACTSDCTDRMCGPDGCGGYCGRCGVGTTCDDFGQCAPSGAWGDAPSPPKKPTSPGSRSWSRSGVWLRCVGEGDVGGRRRRESEHADSPIISSPRSSDHYRSAERSYSTETGSSHSNE